MKGILSIIIGLVELNIETSSIKVASVASYQDNGWLNAISSLNL